MTRKFSVIGCRTGMATGVVGPVPTSWPRPLASMMRLVPTSAPHSRARAMSPAGSGVEPFSGGSISRSSLPPRLRKARSASSSARQKVGRRTGDHDQRGIVRDLALLSQRQLRDFEVVRLERLRHPAVARRFRGRRVAFAMALKEIDLLRAALDDLLQRVRDALLIDGRGLLASAGVLEDNRRHHRDAVLLRINRVVLRVDVLRRDLLRQVGVLREPVPVLGRAVDVERLDDQRLIQTRHDLPGLIRKRELAAGRQVPPLVLPVRDPVDRDEDAEHDQHARGGNRAVLDVPSLKRARDVAPLAERVQCRDDEPAERQALIPGRQVRAREAQDDGGHDEQDAYPPEKSEESLHG